MLHNRHRSKVKKFHAWSDRVASLDLTFSNFTMRVVAVYMPHAGYSHEYLLSVHDQVQACVDEALKHNDRVIIGGDFNTQLHLGPRGVLLHELVSMFGLRVANSEQNEDSWTFCSSMDVRRQIDFIMHSLGSALASLFAISMKSRNYFLGK